MSVKLKTASNGSVTLSPEDTASDVVVNVPAVAGTVLTSVSDIEAQVKTATNATGDAPVYACRAWCNFDGTGTVAIRASGNVSSITDNGTGDYTVNFTTAMPDANYSITFGGGQSGDFFPRNANDLTANNTTAFRVVHRSGNTYFDTAMIHVAIFR